MEQLALAAEIALDSANALAHPFRVVRLTYNV
jgi:hypothetical protein